MIGIEETENLISNMRNQAQNLLTSAKALESGADALENAIAPVKLAMGNYNAWQEFSKKFFDMWSNSGHINKEV